MTKAFRINRLHTVEISDERAKEMEKKRLPIFFNDPTEVAEFAVKELGRSDADIQILSISDNYVHYGEPDFENYNTGNRLNFWIKLGAFWLV